MNPSYDFAGQVAVITGASSGMGHATAQAFAQAGASVVLADINETALHDAADSLAAAGHQVLDVVCDVSDESQVASLVDRTVATFGRAATPPIRRLVTGGVLGSSSGAGDLMGYRLAP